MTMERKNPFDAVTASEDNSSDIFDLESDPQYEKSRIELQFHESMKEADTDTIDNLSEGMLAEVLPELQKSQATLNEVTENQQILLETLQQENAKFNTCLALDATTDLMNKAKLYHTILLKVKQDMATIRDKSMKLQKRAVKLQQQKQRELLKKEQEKERELERERKLTARPVKKASS